MRFGVLGPLVVEAGGDEIDLGGPRPRALLALLVSRRPESVQVDAILDQIWPDKDPHSARRSLHTHVSNLRRALGPDRLERAPGGYRFTVCADDSIDASEFERLVEKARRTDPENAVEVYASALALWRGPAFEGLEDVPSVMAEAKRLEELRWTATEERYETELAAGAVPSIATLASACEQQPFREGMWGLLMRAQYRAGRQTEALDTYRRVRQLLGEELGLEPSPALDRLEEQILLHDPALLGSTPAVVSLPASITPLVGRRRELADLAELLRSQRLVTVLGPGGAGKSRLATETARRVQSRFPDGIWWIDLAQVAADGDVAAATAATVGLPVGGDPTASLIRFLRSRSALLILDNCEHLASPSASLAVDLLQRTRLLRVLATSRVALDRPGEHRFLLSGLDLGDEDGDPGDAERLYAARASEAAGSSIDAGHAAVRSICSHLDGMPLAIELAAARAGSQSPSEIDHLLLDRFALLTRDEPSDRDIHRSLQATLDWSLGLLDPRDRVAFVRLGVFDGPFGLTAAGAVLDLDDVGTAHVIDRLVGASLLHRVDETEESRFRLLETMRLYARTELERDPDSGEAVRRHALHHRRVCADLRDAFFGAGIARATREIDRAYADHLAAFEWSLRHEPEEAIEHGWALGNAWMRSGRLAEGDRQLTRLLELQTPTHSRQRADTLLAGAQLLEYTTDYERGLAWSAEAVDRYRALGDDRGLSAALSRHGHVAMSLGDFPTALADYAEALDVAERAGYREGRAYPLVNIAQARLWQGDDGGEVGEMVEQARQVFLSMEDANAVVHCDMVIGALHQSRGGTTPPEILDEMISLTTPPQGDPGSRATALHSAAWAAFVRDDLVTAAGLNRALLTSAREAGAVVTAALGLLQNASLCTRAGDFEKAALMLGTGRRHFTMALPAFMKRLHEGVQASIENGLGAARTGELLDEGAAMTLEQAIDRALD